MMSYPFALIVFEKVFLFIQKQFIACYQICINESTVNNENWFIFYEQKLSNT